MRRVGVRELKERTAEILRNVRENRTEYVITYRGRPVAILLPVGGRSGSEAEEERAVEELWADLEALRQEIERSWQSGKSAVELISEQRR